MLADCICDLGFTGPDGGTCAKCDPGTYKNVNGSSHCLSCPSGEFSGIHGTSCVACPVNMNAAEGANAVTDCRCQEGYTGSYGVSCEACPSGKYKGSIGSALCSLCPVGKYSSATAQTSVASCVTCPDASSSPPGSGNGADCICNIGFTGPNGQPCAPCAVGKYKDLNGTVECQSCPSVAATSFYDHTRARHGFRQVPGWNTTSLPASTSLSSCTCAPGSLGNTGGPCSPTSWAYCRNCQVSLLSGNAQRMSFESLATGFVDGHPNDVRFKHPRGVATSPDGAMVAVADTGNNVIRLMQGARSDYQLLHQEISYTSTLVGNPISFGFADGIGSAIQLLAPEGISFSPDGQKLAVTSTYNVRVLILTSRSSTTLAGGQVPGFADGVGTQALFSQLGGIAFSPDGLYLALADKNNNAIRMVVVATGECQTLVGAQGGGAYVDGTSARFNSPHSVSFHPTDGDILIVSDMRNHAIRLVQVSSGNTRTLAGLGAAFQSSPGYSDGSFGGAVRFSHPQGISYSPDGLRIAVADPGNQAIRIVNPNTGATFTLAGSLPGSFIDGAGSAARFKNPEQISFSPDGLGLVVADADNHAIRRVQLNCKCDAGFSGQDGEACSACLDMQYKSTVGSSSCIACNENASSVWGSPFCSCNAGHTGPDGGPCVPCEEGTFKANLGSLACTMCPDGIWSPHGSTSDVNCSCGKGYSGHVPCTPCPEGTYKNFTGPGACLACPGKSSSPVASEGVFECNIRCPVGSTGPLGGPCTLCPAGSQKNVTGPAMCSPCFNDTFAFTSGVVTCAACPKNSYSRVGQSICNCTRGYKRRSGDDGQGACLIRILDARGDTSNFREFMVELRLSVDVSKMIGTVNRSLVQTDQWWEDLVTQKLIDQIAEFFSCDPNQIFVGEFSPQAEELSPARRALTPQSVDVAIVLRDDPESFSARTADLVDSLNLFLMPACTVLSMGTTCGAGFAPPTENMTIPFPDGDNASTVSCLPCAFGYFKTALDNSDCTACPEYSTTEESGSVSVLACECYDGFAMVNVSAVAEQDSQENGLQNESQTNSSSELSSRRMPGNQSNLTLNVKCVPSGVSIADARRAAAQLSVVVGAVVGANVAMSVGSSAMSTTGGAGAAGGAGMLPLVTQVQLLNQVGKIGGDEGSASVGAFSEGFGWANLEWGLATRMGYGDRMPTKQEMQQRRREIAAAVRRKGVGDAVVATQKGVAGDLNMSNSTDNSTNSSGSTGSEFTNCTMSLLYPSIETMLTCFITTLLVYLAREMGKIFFKEVLMKDIPTSLMFPAWEGVCVCVSVFVQACMCVCVCVGGWVQCTRVRVVTNAGLFEFFNSVR